jgi:SMODS-associated and fused to various effectors sensor domain
VTVAGRAGIHRESTLRLWVAAGGRCEYCNEYLLEDGFTGYELNLAEQAHIVGASDTPGSPRGASTMALAARAEPENLMLLCRAHHLVIDRLIAEHTVEGLLQMKREHEARIRALTAITSERGSIVLRVIGTVRGAAVQIPRSTVAATVTADGRFPRYPLALAGEDLEVDLRNLPEEGQDNYWSVGVRMIEQAANRLRDAQAPIAHVSVFAIARIPLLIALGFHLDDKIAATIYQRRRDGAGDGNWLADPDAPVVAFEHRRIAGDRDSARVALAVSLTAPIGEEVAAAADAQSAVYAIAPVGVPCGRDVLGARASLENFAETYHQLLAKIEQEHPSCRELLIFPACPASAAVALGRGVMRDAQPALIVYDRASGGSFQRALDLR